MENKKKVIEIIVPCYNEGECVRLFYDAIKKEFEENIANYSYRIFFIDDGSKDNTLDEIKKIVELEDEGVIKYTSFSRNFGKESALYIGFAQSTGDLVVPMDADLQHPPRLLHEMVAAIESGYDCAAARRVSRKGEGIVRSFFSSSFYHIINALTSVKMVPGSTDYRMMTRMVVDAIVSFSERDRFTKGIYSWIGFKTKWIDYHNVERAVGKTKWSFRGLIHYATSGYFSFATRPLRIILYLGVFTTLIAVIYAIYFAICTLMDAERIRNGYTTVLVAVTFFGGIITTLLGVIGEYLARIYMEVKQRPIYLVRETNVEENEE